MKIILIGYGTVGREVEKVLSEKKLSVSTIIRSGDTFDEDVLDSETYLFICVPSNGTGEDIANYYRKAFEKGSKIITCEKAFIAWHWKDVDNHRDQIRYSATVGGDSGILDAVAAKKGNIKEINAVINGTLNYIGEKMSQSTNHEEIYQEVISKGLAEPGSKNLEEVMNNELGDVLYKTIILANHSGLYDRVIEAKDIELHPYKDGLRCHVFLNKDQIKTGFFEDDRMVFPSGSNNVIYINNIKCAEGAGAGGRITAERMFRDFKGFS